MNAKKQSHDWRTHLAPDWQVRDFVKRYRRVAIIGIPADPNCDAVVRAERLLAYDFQLFAVHSQCATLLGQPCSPHLHAVPGEIDILLVLPTAETGMLHLVNEAIRKRVKVFWVEDAPIDQDAAELLMQEGIHVVAERSLEREFFKL